MHGVDPEIGSSSLRLWLAAGSAASLLALLMALFRTRSETVEKAALCASLVAFGAVLGAALTWAFFDHSGARERAAERRILELRAEQLKAQVLAPGSPLACLDAFTGEGVAAACEKALFASPATVAAASSYVAAKLSLLSAVVAHSERGGADLDKLLLPLRRSLEGDRFGFVAHVLAIRDGCTAQNCKALAMLRDASRVRVNLDAQALDQHLQHYQELWAKAAAAGPEGAVASASAPRRLVNIDFPSAASIPSISIMNPEPAGPVLPGVAAAAAANPNPQQSSAGSSRHPRKQTANVAAQALVAPKSGSAAVEPIWPEPVPLPPPARAAPAGAVGAPVQLGPPSAGAGAAPMGRTQ